VGGECYGGRIEAIHKRWGFTVVTTSSLTFLTPGSEQSEGAGESVDKTNLSSVTTLRPLRYAQGDKGSLDAQRPQCSLATRRHRELGRELVLPDCALVPVAGALLHEVRLDPELE
jgi:hypothetical protein